MFERLGKTGEGAILAAQMEAARRGDDASEDYHLLAGCLAAGGEAASVLRAEGVTRDRFLAALDGLDAMGDAGLGPADADALASVGIDLNKVIAAADEVFGPDALHRAPSGRRRGPQRTVARMGESAKAAISGAFMEAMALGDRRMESKHLLLAIMHHPSPTAATVCRAVGLDEDRVQAALTGGGNAQRAG